MTPGSEDSGSSCSWDSCQHWSDNERGTCGAGSTSFLNRLPPCLCSLYLSFYGALGQNPPLHIGEDRIMLVADLFSSLHVGFLPYSSEYTSRKLTSLGAPSTRYPAYPPQHPQVYNRPELFLCAKCKQTTETTEHMFECADCAEIEACFRDRYRSSQPSETEPIDISALGLWDWLGLLQGRVHPSWKSMIPTLKQGMQRTASTAAVIQQLLCASLETWYHAIWLPRCKWTIE
jgi:hypothetical protein